MIEPRILKGFRDFLPEMMLPRKELINKLEKIFQLFGFSPIDTPALEYTEILLGKGGGETDKQIYRFTDNGGRDVALRFDLTVPLARFVAQHYHELVLPFKRYHIAPVWRAEKPQNGRFREFYQCDFDIIGVNSIHADLEILLLIKEGIKALDCGKFTVTVNHRKLINAVLEKMGITDQTPAVLRAIDKFYKMDYQAVLTEMSATSGIAPATCEEIFAVLNLKADQKSLGLAGDQIIPVLAAQAKFIAEKDQYIIDELKHLFSTLDKIGALPFYRYNPAITRGLDYYTGIVFETFVDDYLNFGSICSGGRYDNLTGLYSKNPVTGVGAAVGLDRILALMDKTGQLADRKSSAEVLVFNLDDQLFDQYLILVQK
ncbi:MAG: histidine--tRNA ligase, partial [Spirochaetes bacterium]|nr:histidine--tRNA ligase [Spirochaetota bacterium]